jgi:radical SAM protein with 4Fe4S-binding SPASM domain
MSPFVWGKWNAVTKTFDIFDDKVKALRARASTEFKHCQKCDAKLHCGGYCLGEVLNETGKLDDQKPIVCNAIRRLLNSIGTSTPYEYLHP